MNAAALAFAPAAAVVAALLAGGRLAASPEPAVARFGQPDSAPHVTAPFGQRVLLQWTEVGPDAILVGHGRVPPSGEREVSPADHTVFTLISGDGSDVRFRSVVVWVKGGRGAEDGDSPGPDQYVHTLKSMMAGKAYTSLVEGVVSLLQEVCGYYVRGDHLPSQPDYTLYTNRAVAGPAQAACFAAPDGFDPATRKVRTSLLVRLTPVATRQTHVEIGALAHWRYAQEMRWRDFDDHDAYRHRISTQLRNRIEQVK